MSEAYTNIQLDKLPAPQLIDEKSADDIFAEMKVALLDAKPDLEPYLNLESEPLTIALEQCAWREYVLRQRVNHAAKSVMLAFAGGTDLVHLAALFGITRAQVEFDHELEYEPTPATNPELFEDDKRLRRRVQLALEGFTNAGSVGAYTFHALSASGDVKDVSVKSPAPGQVEIYVLSRASDEGEADQALLEVVANGVNADDVRPLTDQVSVQSATIETYQIEAVLTLLRGADEQIVMSAAQTAISAYADTQHRLGHDITLSGIYAALHKEGVHSVNLISPVASIEIDDHQAAHCTNIDVSVGGRDV